MSGSVTLRPSLRAVVLGLAWLVLAGTCAWRWWWAPRQAAAARALAPELEQTRALARERLRELGIDTALDDHARVHLAWREPDDCVERYELIVDEDFRDPSVAVFVGREPEHSRWTLSLARREGASSSRALTGTLERTDAREPAEPARAPAEAVPSREPAEPARAPAEAVASRELVRELWWSSRELGPAAPDFACRRRSWDPLEDALALGWPLLPEHELHVGDTWIGAAVEGRCHETVCLDERGQFSHARPCRARPWQEQLAGAGDGIAVLRSTWDDGHDPTRSELGILTRRLALIQAGRPLLVRVEIDHRWSGVHRTLELRRIDSCGA